MSSSRSGEGIEWEGWGAPAPLLQNGGRIQLEKSPNFLSLQFDPHTEMLGRPVNTLSEENGGALAILVVFANQRKMLAISVCVAVREFRRSAFIVGRVCVFADAFARTLKFAERTYKGRRSACLRN